MATMSSLSHKAAYIEFRRNPPKNMGTAYLNFYWCGFFGLPRPTGKYSENCHAVYEAGMVNRKTIGAAKVPYYIRKAYENGMPEHWKEWELVDIKRRSTWNINKS